MIIRVNKIWICLLVVSIIAVAIELFYNRLPGFEFMPLIPLTYALAVTISGAGNDFFSSDKPGMSVVNGLYFIKSVVYTLLQSITGSIGSNYMIPTAKESTLAVLMCIGEIIVIYFCYWFINRNNTSIVKTREMHIEATIPGKRKNIVLFTFFLFVFLLILNSPSVLYRYNFFTISSVNLIQQNASNIEANSFTTIMVEWAKVLLPVIICMWSFKGYQKSKKSKYVYISIGILCLLSMIVTGVSRTSFVVTGLSSCFLLLQLYPEKRREIRNIFGVVLTIVFITFSFTRFSNFMGLGKGNGHGLSDATNTLQAYFCGIVNNAASIRTREHYLSEINYNTFLSDMFDNWMWVGKFFRNSPNITEFFNQTIHSNVLAYDQIVPTVGQSFIQFGLFGIYIYTIIMVLIIMKSDRLVNSSSRIEYQYLYILISVKCAVTLMGNLKIFMASALNTFLPLYIIFTINKILDARNIKKPTPQIRNDKKFE